MQSGGRAPAEPGQVGDYQLRLPFAAEEALGEEDGTFSYFELVAEWFAEISVVGS